jgi:hypothetical protein
MKRNKSKFLAFCFSLLPGAGHMYMGFMKMGLSLMAAFFFIIFLSSFLNIAQLLFILPILWFFAFFDCMNKCYAPDEEFLRLEDNYLFSIDELVKMDKGIFKKHKLFAGIVLLILGLYLVFNNILDSLSNYMTPEFYNVIDGVIRVAPKVVIGIVIIVVGVKLIIGKKRERDIDG